MLKTRVLFLAFWVLPGPVLAQDAGARAREVLTVEDRRFTAMRQADTSALRDLLSDSLAYTHATGRQDTKASLLRSLATGAQRYEIIAPEARTVHVEGPVAIVIGQSTMRAGAPGGMRTFRIRYLAVYSHRGATWQLRAWQATRLPDDGE